MIKIIQMVFIAFFFILSSVIVILFVALGSGERATGVGVEFLAKGKEAGLSIKDIRMLKMCADKLGMERPLTLLGSVKHVDDAILRLNNILENENYTDYEIIDLLEDLHSYRKRIEVNRLKNRPGIKDSRELSVTQDVKIMVGSLEKPIIGTVTELNPDYLQITLKHESVVKPGINWKGPINVYFWRKNDAGYFFETKVIETRSNLIWHIAHSSELIRSQKREDLRVDVDISCYLYKLEDITKSDSKPMGFTGMFGQLKNISEGGAAFLINGKVANGSTLKLEFKLNEKVLVFCGVVKSSSYNSMNNISYVRMKIVDPSFEMLSILRPYIFIKTRNLVPANEFNNPKTVENKDEINNNISDKSTENSTNSETSEIDDDEVTEVEYISEESIVTN